MVLNHAEGARKPKEYRIGDKVPIVDHECFPSVLPGQNGEATEIMNGLPTKAKCFTCNQIIAVKTNLLLP